jgi:membrane protease YdiL (CAAX protease family)
MQYLSPSTSTYIALIIILAALGAANVFLPQGSFVRTLPEQQLPAPKPVMALATAGLMLIVYGGLGFVGLQLSRKLGFPDLWDPAVSNRHRLLIPALAGAGTGVFFIVADTVLRQLHTLGPLPHPPFPTSIVASVVAGIGEETIFRLFFIPFWVWLISIIFLKGRWQTNARASWVFWVVAVVSALAFALGHLPSVMAALGLEKVDQVPMALMVEMLLLNGALSLLAAHYLRRYGFLATVSVHFWTDVVWHVIWGPFANLP